MKSRNEEPSPILLSKRNARSLLVRNAIDAATLEKEARLLQSERKSEERLFCKKREAILQRRSRIFERQKSSVSLPEKESNPSPSKEKLTSLRRSHSQITLPDIHAAQRKMERFSKKHSDTDVNRWQVNGKGFSTDTCPVEDWTELGKCRYLRSCSRNEEMLEVEQLSDRLTTRTSHRFINNPISRNEAGNLKWKYCKVWESL